MAIAAVGSPLNIGGTSGTTFDIGTKTWTAGNFIIIWVAFEDITVSPSVSGGGNMYTPLTQPSPDGIHGCMFYAYNIAGGSYTLTVASNGASFPFASAIAQEYSGLMTTDPIDVQTTGFDGGGATALPSTAALNTTANDTIVFAALGLYGSQTIVTAGGGAANWTPVYPAAFTTSNSYKLFSRTVSATGNYQIVGTTTNPNALELNASQNWVAVTAAFKAAVGNPDLSAHIGEPICGSSPLSA